MKTQIGPHNNLRPKKRMPRLRLGLFAVMFVLVMMMGARVSEVVQQLAHGEAPSAVPQLMAESAPAKTDEAPAKEPAKEAAKPETAPAASPAAPGPTPAPATASTEEAPAEDTSTAEPENYTEAEVNILKKLSERRQEIDRRAREVDQREALLRVTEQRVDKKIGDLKAMQEEIRKVLGDADKAQVERVAAMVKVYETMKPKDAAKIFENMDVPVLLSVVPRMKEARVAPILAAMDPVKAKELSTALMEKKPLPAAP